MRTVTGIFPSRAAAERAVSLLSAAGVAAERITFLAPGATPQEIEAEVPTTETEQPGMGKALGGTVGGALGVAGGLPLGAAAASLLVPGVGPVLAAGLIGAALLGAGGAVAGAAAGDALEDSMAEGLPHDELFVYEDALRQGRSIVLVMAEDDAQGEAAQGILAGAGAESLDAAREDWWVGLRDAEKEDYHGQGRDFEVDEPIYRHGFEAALHPRTRGKSYDECDIEEIRRRYGDEAGHDAFRCGYDRGYAYYENFSQRQGG